MNRLTAAFLLLLSTLSFASAADDAACVVYDKIIKVCDAMSHLGGCYRDFFYPNDPFCNFSTDNTTCLGEIQASGRQLKELLIAQDENGNDYIKDTIRLSLGYKMVDGQNRVLTTEEPVNFDVQAFGSNFTVGRCQPVDYIDLHRACNGFTSSTCSLKVTVTLEEVQALHDFTRFTLLEYTIGAHSFLVGDNKALLALYPAAMSSSWN